VQLSLRVHQFCSEQLPFAAIAAAAAAAAALSRIDTIAAVTALAQLFQLLPDCFMRCYYCCSA
jgi:hypothetical protein